MPPDPATLPVWAYEEQCSVLCTPRGPLLPFPELLYLKEGSLGSPLCGTLYEVQSMRSWQSQASGALWRQRTLGAPWGAAR